MQKKRFELIDHIKALAVILMIIFHFVYDIYILKIVEFNMRQSTFWYCWPKIIISLFLISTGLNLCIVHYNKIKLNKAIKQFFKLAFVATIISISTYYFFPTKWIYFGIINNVAVASIIRLAFIRLPKSSLIIGVTVLFPSVFYDYDYPIPKLV